MTTTRTQKLVQATLTAARRLKPDRAPTFTDDTVREWAAVVDDKLGIYPPRSVVWEMAVRDWAADTRDEFLNVGVVIRRVREAHARWVEDPKNYPAVLEDRAERQRQKNLQLFGTPDGRTPLPPPEDRATAEQIAAVKRRFPQLDRRNR